MIWWKRAWLAPALSPQLSTSWAETGVLNNLNIVCSQICGVWGRKERARMRTHGYTYGCSWVYEGQRSMSVWVFGGQRSVSLFTLHLIFWAEILNPELIDLAWPQASTCQSSCISVSPGYCRCISQSLGLYMNPRDLNSCCHACVTDTLSAELSPSPQVANF